VAFIDHGHAGEMRLLADLHVNPATVREQRVVRFFVAVASLTVRARPEFDNVIHALELGARKVRRFGR
jgi:hypothetical protein